MWIPKFLCILKVTFFAIVKELTIILFCTWKFAATFPVAIYVMRMSALETLIYTNTGGFIGLVFSLSFSNLIIKAWNKYRARSYRTHGRRKIFTRANRNFVKIKNRYGLPGIAILSPSVLSIPIGAFLAAKYYGTTLKVYSVLIAGQILWSFVFTLFYTQARNILI